MGGLRLGRIMGIEVRVHASWLVIAGLVMWSLMTTAIPADFPAVTPVPRLFMAAGITFLFFVSLLAHELAHSAVAKMRGIPVHRITFFLFGGMAQTSMDSRSPLEEFLIAIAGPVCSLLLAALFFAVWMAGAVNGWPAVLAGGAIYIAVLNLVLCMFNLLPGYPMDGGRVLRSVIWKATGSVTRATRWASRVGEWMAYGLMLYGAWSALNGDVMGGVWLVLIAMFIRNAARMGYRQHVASRLHDAARAYGGPAGSTPGGPMGGAMGDPMGGSHRRPPPPELTGRDVTDLRPSEH